MKSLFLGSCLLLAACENNTERDRAQAEIDNYNYVVSSAKQQVDKMVYLKDSKTGLCFGYSWVAGHSPTMTNVPCEAVEQVLLK